MFESKNRRYKIFFCLTVFCLLGVIWYFWPLPMFSIVEKKSNSQSGDPSELIAEVGKLVILPTDEEPTIATVTDLTELQKQEFFRQAKIGDKVIIYVKAGKAILCTKPLARNAEEAKRILDTVEKAGVFAGYLEDLCYTPKTLKAVKSVESGAVGDVLWVRSRETHPGPHSAWFWDDKQAGGGCIIDLGCH